MGDLVYLEEFKANKLSREFPLEDDVITYTDLAGHKQYILRGHPVTLREWDLMPPWLKGLYHHRS